MVITNSSDKLIHLESEIEFKNEGDGKEGPGKVEFKGYSGAAVNLSSYGFDAPVVYDLEGVQSRERVPILYRHGDEIGHTTEIVNSKKDLTGKGVLSVPGPSRDKVSEGMKNDFPWEGSMGLDVPNVSTSLKFYRNGTRVNGRDFQGPVYVFHNSVLREMTVTPFGRDSDTSFKYLNEDELMRIKNEDGGNPSETETKPKDQTPADTGVNVNNEPPQETPKETVPPIQNSNTVPPVTPSSDTMSQVRLVLMANRLNNDYPDGADLIENGIANGWEEQRIVDAIKLRRYENGLPRPPKGKKEEGGEKRHDLFQARVMASYGIPIERIENEFGKKIADQVDSMPEMMPAEQLVYVANQEGGDYTGHSDIEVMCKFLKNSGFSTIDFPNLLQKTSNTMLEERWKINPPFATQYLMEESNKDFRKTERRRITGGDLWQGLTDEGKIKHWGAGSTLKYESELETVAALFVMTRKEIINDDQGALRQSMESMVEGAMMVPDIMLGRLLLKDAASGSFWVNSDNSFTGTALTRANLKARWNAVRKYNESKEGIEWPVMINDRWRLITSLELEEDAFEILGQQYIVNDTTANTKTGQRNFWYKKLDQATYPFMSAAVMGSGTFVHTGTWMLWPSSKKFSPYTITYLRGRKRPVIEPVQLPEDMLGRGIRGYWDVNVNERERLAIVRATSNS